MKKTLLIVFALLSFSITLFLFVCVTNSAVSLTSEISGILVLKYKLVLNH